MNGPTDRHTKKINKFHGILKSRGTQQVCNRISHWQAYSLYSEEWACKFNQSWRIKMNKFTPEQNMVTPPNNMEYDPNVLKSNKVGHLTYWRIFLCKKNLENVPFYLCKLSVAVSFIRTSSPFSVHVLLRMRTSHTK